MRTMQRSREERRLRESSIEPTEPTTPVSSRVAAVLAFVAVLGLGVLIAAAFFAIVWLFDVISWSVVGPVAKGWS